MENSKKPEAGAYPGRSTPAKTEVKPAEVCPPDYVKKLREKQLDKNWPYVGN